MSTVEDKFAIEDAIRICREGQATGVVYDKNGVIIRTATENYIVNKNL